MYNDLYPVRRYRFYFTATTKGWYRVVMMNAGHPTVTFGNEAPGFQLYMNRVFNASSPESHHIGCLTMYGTYSKFYNIASYSSNHFITSIRHCVSADHSYAAFDIYYNSDNGNTIRFILDNLGTTYIFPAPSIKMVPETSDEYGALTTFTIPANAFFTS